MDEFLNIGDLNLEESSLSEIMGSDYIAPEQEKEEDKNQELENNNSGQPSEEDKEKEIEGQKTPASPSAQTDENTSPFPDFANLLKEAGALSIEDEDLSKIQTADDLVNAVRKTIEDSKFANLSDSQKRYLESIEAGIPQKDYEVIEQQLAQLESITDEDIEGNDQIRFDLIAYDLINQGLSKEKAIEMANRSLKLGTDTDDAKEALDNLLKFKAEEFKKTITSKKEEVKISLEKVKESINAKDVILKDIKVTDKDKKELFDLVTLKVDSDELGQPLNEVNKWRKDKGLEAEIILAALYRATNKFESLGKILDTSKSQAALQLEKKLRQNEVRDLSDSFTLGNKQEYTIDV